MQNQHNDGSGATRAETEATAPTPKPRHSTRPKPPRFLYVLDYEKRFPGTKPKEGQDSGPPDPSFILGDLRKRPFAAENPRTHAKKFVSEASFAL